MHQNHATMHNDILRIKKFFMLLVLGQGQKQKGRRQEAHEAAERAKQGNKQGS